MAKSRKAYDGITFPGRHDAMNALERHMESLEAEKLWIDLCQECCFKPYTEELCELEEIYITMSRKGGKIGVTGSSMLVRMISYKLIKNQHNG